MTRGMHERRRQPDLFPLVIGCLVVVIVTVCIVGGIHS